MKKGPEEQKNAGEGCLVSISTLKFVRLLTHYQFIL